MSSIHNASYRKDKTFMPINCAALPESILESLLFGTRRGAFTGAEDRVGLIEECSGGTIYLDEINSMPLKLQSKLLRVLDTKTVMALGASKPKEVDIRIVASVNRSPEQLMQNKEMLPDLFYRLNAIHIRVPPLRSRPEDIELLAQHFLDSYNRQLGKQNNGISPEAMELLKTYHWPGNVRELEHTIEAALNLTDGSRELRVEDIPAYFFSPAGAPPPAPAERMRAACPMCRCGMPWPTMSAWLDPTGLAGGKGEHRQGGSAFADPPHHAVLPHEQAGTALTVQFSTNHVEKRTHAAFRRDSSGF